MKQDAFLFGVALVLTALAAAACGGDVQTSASSAAGAGGGTGGAGSGGSTAATGSTGSGGSTAATGGTGGAMGKVCGGFAELMCDENEFCDYPDGNCGGDDSTGVCVVSSGLCTDDCPGVCGCDGKFYCNKCEAETAGVDVKEGATCPDNSAKYSALAWFGGLDHLMFRKADAARNICVEVHMARPNMNSPGFSFNIPAEWGVVSATISDQAADCDAMGQPVGQGVNATGGMGTVTFNIPPGGFFPCDVSVQGSLSFPAGEPWVLPSEPLNAAMVVVKDGCQ